MNPAARLPLRRLPRAAARARPLHGSAARPANVAPVVGTGPPPEPPTPAARNVYERLERRKRQAEMLQAAQVIRSASDGKATTLRRRFWKDVAVGEVQGKVRCGARRNSLATAG